MSISLAFLLYAGICGLGAVIAEPERGNFSLGQHMGMGALLVLLAYVSFGWLLGPLLPALADLWFIGILLTAAVMFLAAIPAAMFVYSLNLRQSLIVATTVAIGHVLISLFTRWAFRI